MTLLEMKQITKIFFLEEQSIIVLQDISFRVQEGEFLAITGPSGSGKSTLMYLLGCLDIPTSGSYLFEGKDVSLMTPNELAHIRNTKIGFVFQQFHLLPDLTAIQNVALSQLYANIREKKAHERAQEMLELVDLGHRLNHYPNQLSGGQQQRVAIARALINNPSLILADEPTGNVDSKTGEAIIDIFLKLNQEQQVTTILVTHDRDLAERTSRIIKLLDGKIIEDKPIE